MRTASGPGRRLVRLLAVALAALSLVTVAPGTAVGAAAATIVPCSYRSSFGNQYYCRVPIERVLDSTYATGSQVYLNDAFVTQVTDGTVTVAQTRYVDDCPAGQICGAGVQITFVYLTVSWSGSHRPAYGTKLRLYGTTVPRSLSPTGYVRTGYCTIENAQLELC